MPEIRKATLKSYDAGMHRATLQIAGSLGVWLPSVRVATNIPPADVVAGRQCTVLFLDPANPDEAVVIAVQGALPSVGVTLEAAATGLLATTAGFQTVPGCTITLTAAGDYIITATVYWANGGTGWSTGVASLFIDGTEHDSNRQMRLDEAALGSSGDIVISYTWRLAGAAGTEVLTLRAKNTGGSGTLNVLQAPTALVAHGLRQAAGGGGASAHDDLTGVTSGQHHAQQHAIDGGDHTGSLDHGALTGLDGDDHGAVYGALGQAETVNALWTFAAGATFNGVTTFGALATFNAGLKLAAGFAITDSGGSPRITPATSSPHVTLTGDTRINGAIGIDMAATPQYTLSVGGPNLASNEGRYISFEGNAVTLTPSSQLLVGLFATPTIRMSAGTTGHVIYGLFFSPFMGGGASFTGAASEMRSVYVDTTGFSFNGTLTLYQGARLETSWLSGSPTITTAVGLSVGNQGHSSTTTAKGIEVDAQTAGTNRYGITVADLTAGTKARILELGGADSAALMTLKGTGEWTPAANETPLWLAEGATPTLRQVKWKDGAAIGAGDKVAVLV